ncbi:MAG: DegT/DnrJ/EryC1/StrS family aminotransferase [Candidatus Omnitrophica bacterium]|nr:DegT/DnrJ/EryC1/StrS family aminotransferase [Candidatus Omnitrophota bacterium]
MIPLVNLNKQYALIKDEIKQAVDQTLESMAFINGPQIKKFEADFAAISGAKFGVGASSGTTALQLALTALGVGDGDEVLTVPNTFIATTESITHTGAKVVFVDVDEKTYNIDPKKLEKAITKKTKAIIPVHLYGQPCDIDAIDQIARKHQLKVIYDSAQSHLAEYNGKPIGHYGDAVCYSFYPGKNLGAYGDGGLVVTNDEELRKKMFMLADHGRIDKYEHLMEGFNFRLSEIQAAILNVKLKYLPQWTKGRQNHAEQYNLMLKNFDVITPYIDPKVSHVFHLYVIRLKNRDAVLRYLHENDIGAGIHYPVCLHLQKAYEYLGHKKGDFPVAEKYSQEILSLPMFPELSHEEQEKVVSALSAGMTKAEGAKKQYV